MDFLASSLARKHGLRSVANTAILWDIPGGEGEQIHIYNAGSIPVAACPYNSAESPAPVAAFGTDSQTANGVGTVIAPGSTQIFTIGQNDRISIIANAAGPAVCYMSRVKGN